MSVSSYTLSLMTQNDTNITTTISPANMIVLLKAWRNSHEFINTCSVCQKFLVFTDNFVLCCNRFFYKPTPCYLVKSIVVPTPGYEFVLRHLNQTLTKKGIKSNQEFLVLPDPIYWQVTATLIYEKTMKFVSGAPMTKKTNLIQPPSKATIFYKQVQEAPLNHGSIFKRSGGKNTLYRQLAFGKRCILTSRAMIVPDSRLAPNEIMLPQRFRRFKLLGQWVIVNRMPSLQPENCVALKVVDFWDHECFGIPLEIVEELNADFDGDEVNLYILQNVQSQAECATLLNPQIQMGSFTCGLKLNPCHDMLVAYYLFYDAIDFLPYKNQSLRTTFKVIYHLYGSEKAFECFNAMRLFYLDALQNKIFFSINLREIEMLIAAATNGFDEFTEKVQDTKGCLITQVRAEAKGSFYHLYQMFGSIGDGRGENSFWKGLNPIEAVGHATDSFDALLRASNIWQPGYGYSKSVYNLQGLHVDYLGRLVDGRQVVVEMDVLDALHHTDVLSEEAFSELVRKELQTL